MANKSFQQMLASSYLSGGSDYLEGLYERYLQDPQSVPSAWREYFESLPYENGHTAEVSHEEVQRHFYELAHQAAARPRLSEDAVYERKQAQVEHLIRDYRRYGHLAARLDPLGSERGHVHHLELEHHDLSKADFDTQFRAPELTGQSYATLKEIYQRLNDLYCRHIGFEYMEIRHEHEVNWLQQKIEQDQSLYIDSDKEKQGILRALVAADCFERTLETKYVGQKRFSIEGGDALIPLLRDLVNRAAYYDLAEAVLGMAHRGRLNVMMNVLGLTAEELFLTFEGREDYGQTTGDVKYHLGYSSDVETNHGPLHIALAFNPSHLEVINSVAMGSVRARQDERDRGKGYDKVLPILVHGDASMSGQGIVMETFNMSQTDANAIGGTVHIVLNNQIGFTTSEQAQARSSMYCTDIARMIDAPVFHVNGDDPEAVVRAARLAMDYRMTFHKDVIIDLICYRRHGHNEADEPSATQPLMYHKIKNHQRPRELYTQKLLSEGLISEDEATQLWDSYRELMDQGKRVVKTAPKGLVHVRHANWAPFYNQEWNVSADTSVDEATAKDIARKIFELPQGFDLQKQVKMILQNRQKMAEGEQAMDWGFAELMAYATLVTEGYPVRLTGQDTQRGTFGHRHAILCDQNTGDAYFPLKHINSNQSRFQVYNSLLSEVGAMGFEYGYATAEPNALVIWEAQFGDFANGAQVIIDQFISSAWQKWQRLNGLVLFLPHGYEGQGPEHSSARLERFMQLSAQKNMQVCVPTTPSQIFHLLRRQIHRPYRKPLVVMTPKSLLRNKMATSGWKDLTKDKFRLIIPEIDDDIKDKQVKRVVLCCGKVYYDLLKQRRDREQKDVALVRIEQLYPFPYEELQQLLQHYKHVTDIVWCQEEPQNQGAWYPNRHRMRYCLAQGQTLDYVGREAFAAPAVGYPSLHKKQQQQLIEDALNT